MTHQLDEFRAHLMAAPFEDVVDLWEMIETHAGIEGKAWLGRNDRFYLLTRLLHRFDAVHPWVYARCREVEREPDGVLDLWAREHFKSTVITFAGIIQELVRDPEITIGIFSHTKPVAKKFLLQIKQELEANKELVAVYPEVFYADPKRESPKWSEEKGLTVKRKSNPKEASVEGHGLVDGQPTGAHFRLRVYDDVVTLESVSTPDQVRKTTTAWEISDNLGAAGPDGLARLWMVGTRYSWADTYSELLERGAMKTRIYPATDNGQPTGNPVLLSAEAWADKKIKQGPATIACQMLLNPAAGNESMFKQAWLSFQEIRPATLNVYIMVDPANSKRRGSDNTAMAVVGVDAANNKYLLDGYCHKMNLKERWEALRGLRKVWMTQPGVQMLRVGVERYGMQADIDYYQERMQAEGDVFEIAEMNWVSDGNQSKVDRIQRLVPDFAAKRFHLAKLCVRDDGQGNLLPYETANQIRARERGEGFRIFKPVTRRDHENRLYSLNKSLLTEFMYFPFSAHDDLLDAISRIWELDPVTPIAIDERMLEPEVHVDGA